MPCKVCFSKVAELVTNLAPEHGSAFDSVCVDVYLFFMIALGAYQVPGTILAIWDILMHKKVKHFCLWRAYILVETENEKINCKL